MREVARRALGSEEQGCQSTLLGKDALMLRAGGVLRAARQFSSLLMKESPLPQPELMSQGSLHSSADQQRAALHRQNTSTSPHKLWVFAVCVPLL